MPTPRILVVEGNPPEANARVVAYGCKPYGPAYADVMRALNNDSFDICSSTH